MLAFQLCICRGGRLLCLERKQILAQSCSSQLLHAGSTGGGQTASLCLRQQSRQGLLAAKADRRVKMEKESQQDWRLLFG